MRAIGVHMHAACTSKKRSEEEEAATEKVFCEIETERGLGHKWIYIYSECFSLWMAGLLISSADLLSRSNTLLNSLSGNPSNQPRECAAIYRMHHANVSRRRSHHRQCLLWGGGGTAHEKSDVDKLGELALAAERASSTCVGASRRIQFVK